MPRAATQLVDPLAAYMEGAFDADRRPVPLVSTCFDVELAAGLASVRATRVFRNAESRSIEATITLPVPVHAQVHGLSARIGDRVVEAVAKAKAQARETYEDAIDRGKAAVLHEGALRGVHVLSVAHIAPGEEIEVRMDWVETLRVAGDRLKLRIPTTVGEIYGRSPLQEADEILTGGENQLAVVNVAAEDEIWLGETRIEGGQAIAPGNRPIDLTVSADLSRILMGRAADGRTVSVGFGWAAGEAPLDVAILVDRSSSMDERSAADGVRTKHKAVVDGLKRASARLGQGDHIRLW